MGARPRASRVAVAIVAPKPRRMTVASERASGVQEVEEEGLEFDVGLVAVIKLLVVSIHTIFRKIYRIYRATQLLRPIIVA